MTPDEQKAALIFSEIMKSTRIKNKWTQVETAKVLGISQSALSKFESGLLIPSIHQWVEFCSNFNISIDCAYNLRK